MTLNRKLKNVIFLTKSKKQQFNQVKNNVMGKTKNELSKRYFNLLERMDTLKYIYQTTYYNETFRLRRIRKLLRLTNRKVSILEKLLTN